MEEQQIKKRVRILSIDGGGMRGIIPARMIAHLEELLKEKSNNPDATISDYFDVVAGTSVGGLISIMLFGTSNGNTPLFSGQDTLKLIAEEGKRIFKIPFPQRLLARFRGIITPRYSTKFFERLLKEHLIVMETEKELTLNDTLKPIVIPCYDLSNAGAFFFCSNNDMKHNFKLWEVCRATTAVPSFFKPIHLKSIDGELEFTAVDGGLVLNNPTAAAITHVLQNKHEFPHVRGTEDLLVLSLGTGQFDKTYEFKKVRKWGAFQWARPIAKIIMDGISDMVDHTVSMAFDGCRDNYLRIQVSGLPDRALMEMDDPSPSNVRRLMKLADDLLLQPSTEHLSFGGRRKLQKSNAERLNSFADQLLQEEVH